MSYLSQAILLVCVLAFALMAEAFWSGLHSEKSFTHSLYQSIAAGSGFIAYAVIDYLMIVPGANYAI